jgi:hypothetical protein
MAAMNVSPSQTSTMVMRLMAVLARNSVHFIRLVAALLFLAARAWLHFAQRQREKPGT